MINKHEISFANQTEKKMVAGNRMRSCSEEKTQNNQYGRRLGAKTKWKLCNRKLPRLHFATSN